MIILWATTTILFTIGGAGYTVGGGWGALVGGGLGLMSGLAEGDPAVNQIRQQLRHPNHHRQCNLLPLS